jgi:nitric oxide reductase NorQ protein
MVKMRVSDDEGSTTLSLRPREDYVDSPAVHALSERALSYLHAGFPLHLRGPAGSGKTTLAFRLASEMDRPVMLLSGDESITTGDLIGKQNSFSHRKVVDRFIHSVLKYEENVEQVWADRKLTVACREGYTLVYDEFTRSRAEANNVLLNILEERLLVLPVASGGAEYVKVHPDFRIIFTSNPREYAGVHSSQDALNDRMITIDMDYFDEGTEIAIAAARSGLEPELAAPIVRMVRGYRASGQYHQIPTPRASIMIARMAVAQNLRPSFQDVRFVQLCLDVLEGKCARNAEMSSGQTAHRKALIALIEQHCNGKGHRPVSPQLRTNGLAAASSQASSGTANGATVNGVNA